MLSIVGIVIALALLIFLAYKGVSLIWGAPICAIIVALFGGIEVLPAYTSTYMSGFANFTQTWFPTFMLGSVFAIIMDKSGAARAVGHWVVKTIGAKFAILAVVLSAAALTYGGISLFVAIFVVYPLALPVFREADVPRELLPGCFTLGAFTFTMTSLPGTPQIQNLIPMEYFGTSANAAPLLGIICSVFTLAIGFAWLTWRKNSLNKKGIHFAEPESITKAETEDEDTIMNPLLAFIPLVVVVVLLAGFGLNIVLCLFIGIIIALITGWKQIGKKGIRNIVKIINQGAIDSMGSIINTSAVVGFGAVVKAVPGFSVLTNSMMGLSASPLISLAVAVNVLAGATGSASGGLGIALEALAERFHAMSQSSGISLEVFHRVASISSGGLDSLPHNGAVVTVLNKCELTHKEAYLDMCVCSVIIPILTTIFAIVLASFGL